MADSTPTDEPSAALAERLAQAGPLPVSDDLAPRTWDAVKRPAVRSPFFAASTPVRQGIAAVGVALFASLLVVVQGVRQDLDADGWRQFAIAAVPMALVGVGLGLRALRHRGQPDRLRAAVVPIAWAWLAGWAALGPWPGMHGVPWGQSVYCFGVTSLVVLAATAWVLLFERSPRPVAWRGGVAASTAGLVAFAAQSVFCPGADWVHLVVGHGGAGIVWAVAAGFAGWLVAKLR